MSDQEYAVLLLFSVSLLPMVYVYVLLRENWYLKSIIYEIKKAHDPMRKHEAMPEDEFWEILEELNITEKEARREIKGRRDHAE